MKIDEMISAVEEAQAIIRRSEQIKNRMASFLVGRLRGISHYTLESLKRELTKYNTKTREWK